MYEQVEYDEVMQEHAKMNANKNRPDAGGALTFGQYVRRANVEADVASVLGS